MTKILKSKKVILIMIPVFLILLAILLIYNSYSAKKKYDEQAVMAERFLDEGSYEKAITAYNKAMSMKYGDKGLISIGLAQAYAGVHNYDKALEVLRSRYQVSRTIEIKENIEEISAEKLDYEFNQAISYGDTYFANEEFNKAIAEYEKAKLIKSKEDITFLKIARSHMEMEEYDLAKEEILEGLALTESVDLESLLAKVEIKLKNLEYDNMLSKASEYIYQENYEEAINLFNQAIWLMPDLDRAYNQMAEFYILIEDYYTAKYLIHNYLRSHNSEESEEVLEKIDKLIQLRERKEELLNELYTALSVVDIETIINIINDPFFVEDIAIEAPLYYNPLGDMNTSFGYGMYIADKNNIYVGGFRDKMKEGIGVQFINIEGKRKQEYYYYQGEWNYNSPYGMGKTYEEVRLIDSAGNEQITTIITSGLFLYGVESGGMKKNFFENGEEIGSVKYNVLDGKVEPLKDINGQPIKSSEPGKYVIGEIYRNNKGTGEYYSVENGTTFSVKHLD